jgi:hypothetical protein
MFDLVADVERYPEFLPLCEALTVRSRKERDGKTLLIADMTVGYKAIRETFTSQVLLKPTTWPLTSNISMARSSISTTMSGASSPREKWRLRSLLLHRLRIQEQGVGRA